MNRNTKIWVSVALLIILSSLIVGGIYLLGNTLSEQSVKGTGFTPIFCNDYEFTCCGGTNQGGLGRVDLLSDNDHWMCPNTAIKCKVTFGGSDIKIYRGSTNCGMRGGINKYFSCDDARPISSSSSTIYKNEHIWSSWGTNAYAQYEVFSERLGFCGRSGSSTDEASCGVKVSGADGCKFNPINSKVYPESGGSAISGSSYVVPVGDCVLAFQSGDRHICGYKEETCSSNTDCTGHTYGRFECNGRNLQEYGCRTFGTAVSLEQDRLAGQDSDFGSTSDESIFGKRCEIITARQVQCCGDTDCGVNMFCDNKGTNPTWTCGASKCTNDVDCGVSAQCDFSTKKMKTPKCSGGTCTYSEKDVECCYDADCPVGNFCNADKKCEKKIADCTQCNFECCDKECKATGGYFDRACPTEKPFCHTDTHTCSTEPFEQCGYWINWGIIKIPNIWCKLNLFLAKFKIVFSVMIGLISGIFGMLISRRFMKDLKPKKMWILAGIIGLIVGVGLGFLAFVYFWLAMLGLAVFIAIKIIF